MRVLLTSRHADHRGGVVSAVRALLPHLHTPITHMVVGRWPDERSRGVSRAVQAVATLGKRRRRHDLLHLNTSLRSRALARDLALLAAWGRGPALAWIHGWDTDLAARLVDIGHIARVYPRLHLATVGAVFREHLVRGGFPASRVHRLEVPWSPAPRPVARRHTVLFLGRLVQGKGAEVLLEAFGAVCAAHGDAVLVFAGEGPEEGRLRAAVARRRLERRVRFVGWVEGAAKARVLAEAAVFVLPSRDEGLPGAMIEAMAAGVPVVARPVGAIPEVLRDGHTGWAVPGSDPAALAAVLAEVLASPDEAARRAGEALDAVEAHRAVRVAARLDALWTRVHRSPQWETG